MTTLLPRVSPDMRRGERKGSPDALQEGPAAPSGATTSVSAKPTGISPDPSLYLRRFGARHQTDHHPAPTRTRSFPHAVSPRHREDESVAVAPEPTRKDPEGTLRAQIWARDEPPAGQHHRTAPQGPRRDPTGPDLGQGRATGRPAPPDRPAAKRRHHHGERRRPPHQDAGSPPAEAHRRRPSPPEQGRAARGEPGKGMPTAASITRPRTGGAR
nr:atherin-like [Aegilops tauschii subsp. strangulata]